MKTTTYKSYRLCREASLGNARQVKALLKDGADVHTLNDASLSWAFVNGRVKVVKILLEAGANLKRLGLEFSSREEAIRYFELMAI